MMPGTLFYSIGHSNHDEDTFVELLGRHAINFLVDVRSQGIPRVLLSGAAQR